MNRRFNETPRRRQQFKAKFRRHAKEQGWCVHCGCVVEPCTCRGCHPAAVVTDVRRVSWVAPWFGDEIADVDREFRWMHEQCITARWRMSKMDSVIMHVKLPSSYAQEPVELPRWYIDLTGDGATIVSPAQHAEQAAAIS